MNREGILPYFIQKENLILILNYNNILWWDIPFAKKKRVSQWLRYVSLYSIMTLCYKIDTRFNFFFFYIFRKLKDWTHMFYHCYQIRYKSLRINVSHYWIRMFSWSDVIHDCCLYITVVMYRVSIQCTKETEIGLPPPLGVITMETLTCHRNVKYLYWQFWVKEWIGDSFANRHFTRWI